MKPSRHPVLKWTGIVLLAIVLAAVLFRVVAGYWADSKLQAELDAIAARGEPIKFADLAREPIPDEDNAALLYMDACKVPLIAAKSGRSRELTDTLRGLTRSPSFRRQHAAEVQEILTEAAEVLRLCRQARGRRGADWLYDYSESPLTLQIDPTDNLSNMARILALAGLEAHDAGDDAAAIGYLRDEMALARSIYRGPFMISYLLALACEAMSDSVVERIAPTAELPAGTPVRIDARELLGELLDEAGVFDALTWAMMSQRSSYYDTMERIKDGRYVGGHPGAFEPMPDLLVTLNEILLLKRGTGFVEASKQRTWPNCRKLIPPDIWEDMGYVREMIFMPASFFESYCDPIFSLHCRHVAMGRMAAVALAMRMYQLDHGRRPGDLAALVPDYLPAVPDDPFSETSRPIGYRPDAEPPVLYSIGEDGKDDGGAFALGDEGGIDRVESPDIVFFLNGDRPQSEFKWDEPQAEEEQPTSAPVNVSD